MINSWAFGSSFQTSFVKVELPTSWSCKNEFGQSLCRSSINSEAREAYLTIKAKLSSNQDSLENYLTILNNPKTFIDNESKVGLSKVYSCSRTNLNGIEWVQALHLNSEVKNYFSKYFVTTKGDLSLSVEFSFHQSKNSKYAKIIEEFSKHIELINNVASEAHKELLPAAQPNFPSNFPNSITEQAYAEDMADNQLNKNIYFLGGFAALIILGLLIYWKTS